MLESPFGMSGQIYWQFARAFLIILLITSFWYAKVATNTRNFHYFFDSFDLSWPPNANPCFSMYLTEAIDALNRTRFSFFVRSLCLSRATWIDWSWFNRASHLLTVTLWKLLIRLTWVSYASFVPAGPLINCKDVISSLSNNAISKQVTTQTKWFLLNKLISLGRLAELDALSCPIAGPGCLDVPTSTSYCFLLNKNRSMAWKKQEHTNNLDFGDYLEWLIQPRGGL